MLGDAAGLAGDDVGAADRVEQRGLAVVDVAHDRDDRRARLQRLGRIDVGSDVSMSTSALADALDVVAELGDQQLGRVLVDRLGDGDRHAHLEQRLDEVGAALGHAVGELLDGDRLGNDDVADLLGRRAGLHVVALFLLAGAAERGERAGAAVVLVGQARGVTVSLPRWRCVVAAAARARRLGPLGRGRMAGRAADGALLVLFARRARRLAALGRRLRRRGAPLPRPAARASSAAASSALRFSSARRRSSSVCSALAARPRGGALPRATAGALPRPRAAACPAAPCGAVMSSWRATACAARRGAAGFGAGLGASATGSGLGASARRRFARAAEDAALLDLDHDRVRAAVAEALLDLAGLDRALEAQRRPGAKLRFFGLVCHSIPSSNLRQPSRSSRRVLRLPDHDRGQ